MNIVKIKMNGPRMDFYYLIKQDPFYVQLIGWKTEGYKFYHKKDGHIQKYKGIFLPTSLQEQHEIKLTIAGNKLEIKYDI